MQLHPVRVVERADHVAVVTEPGVVQHLEDVVGVGVRHLQHGPELLAEQRGEVVGAEVREPGAITVPVMDGTLRPNRILEEAEVVAELPGVSIIGQVFVQLVAERHELAEDEHERMRQLEVSLDQCWDLLRQRRALRRTGGPARLSTSSFGSPSSSPTCWR